MPSSSYPHTQLQLWLWLWLWLTRLPRQPLRAAITAGVPLQQELDTVYKALAERESDLQVAAQIGSSALLARLTVCPARCGVCGVARV